MQEIIITDTTDQIQNNTQTESSSQEEVKNSETREMDGSKQEIKKSNTSETPETHRSMREMDDSKAPSEAESVVDYERRIQELEVELDTRNESESTLCDALSMQTKQLEKLKVLLEESEREIASLQERLDYLDAKECDDDEEIEKLKALLEEAELEITSLQERLDYFDARERDDGKEVEKFKVSLEESEREIASLQERLNHFIAKEESSMCEEIDIEMAEALLEENESLKKELDFSRAAEQESKKAVDELSVLLKEVSTDANLLKAKLAHCQDELEKSIVETECLRVTLRRTETVYEEFLNETLKEAGRYRNTAERLRIEAEESLQAWNGKETEFVNCIKRVELERSASQKETTRLLETVREAEKMTKESKEENQKLRDLLKQALMEANVAKEGAAIARSENAELQEKLKKMEEMMSALTHENEMLKIHEAASFENIKELNRVLSQKSLNMEVMLI